MAYVHYRTAHWPFLINVAFSLLTGLAAVTSYGTLSNFFGLAWWLVAGLGAKRVRIMIRYSSRFWRSVCMPRWSSPATAPADLSNCWATSLSFRPSR